MGCLTGRVVGGGDISPGIFVVKENAGSPPFVILSGLTGQKLFRAHDSPDSGPACSPSPVGYIGSKAYPVYCGGAYPPWGFLFYLSWYTRTLEFPQLVEEQISTPYLERCLFIRLYESSHISSMSLPIDG